MQIDLDRPVLEADRRARWGWLTLLGVASVLIGAAVSPRAVAATRSLPAARLIAFEVHGNGVADYAAVWTQSQVYRYVPSASKALYREPRVAVLTVRSANDRAVNAVTCRIRVDGAIVDERVAALGQSATCTWVAGSAG